MLFLVEALINVEFGTKRQTRQETWMRLVEADSLPGASDKMLSHIASHCDAVKTLHPCHVSVHRTIT